MRVGYLFATTTGEMFGSGSDTDVLEYVDTRPGVTDVVLLIGTNDCVVGCSHGSGGSFNPSSAAVGACNFAQTLANLSYVIAGLEARSIRAWHVTSPGLMGVYAGFGGTYASCVEALVETGGTTTDGLTAELNATQCVGADFCESTNAAYAEACAGSGTTYPDPGGVACGTSNLINYGDGAGKVNRDNSKVYMAEDQVLSQRGGWIPYLHLSGIGHHAIFRTIVNWMKTSTGVSGNGSLDDAEFYGPLFVQDFANRPARPSFTYANLTATSVEITPSIGTYVNGADGTLGYCTGDGQDCYAVCSAQCVDDDKTSTDPACPTGAESAVARNLGTPDGGTHRAGEIANKRGTAVIPFGYTGKLIGLHTATEYALQCYAVSLNGVSHPSVQLVTTP
jgi:hypothetical protein